MSNLTRAMKQGGRAACRSSWAISLRPADRDDQRIHRMAQEVWRIVNLWWLYVAGVALGTISIVHAVEHTRGWSPWLWAFLAMTALCVATARRLIGVIREREAARRELREQNSAEARARRIDDLVEEALLIRDEVPADDWGTAMTRMREVISHFQLRADSEVRRSAHEYMDIWLQDPPDPTTSTFSEPADARAVLDQYATQLRGIAAKVRQS
jgi:hypothetical protein